MKYGAFRQILKTFCLQSARLCHILISWFSFAISRNMCMYNEIGNTVDIGVNENRDAVKVSFFPSRDGFMDLLIKADEVN